MKMKKALLFVVSILLLSSLVYAQESKRSPYMPWEVGADLGISLFGNEFNMNEEARWNVIDHWSSEVAFGGELYVRKYFGYVLGAELAYSYNTLKGDWDESYAPNTPSFKTKVNDIALQAVVNFNNLFTKKRWDRDWYIFGKAGVGIGWVNNEDAVIEDLDDTKFFIPLGLGAAYKLSDDIKVYASADYKFMDTDRLDGRYETGVRGSEGQPTTGVWGSYAMFSLGASYTFGKYRGQDKPMMKTSNVIPESKPMPKPAPRPTPVAPVAPSKPTPKPTPPPTQYKPVAPPAVKPAATMMTYDVIDGMMTAPAGWPVNQGYVYGEIPSSDVKYRVQVFATYHQAKSMEKLGQVIRVSDEMIEYRGKKLYKYAVKKTYDSYKSALAAARQVNRTAKISDAFVVAFKGTKQVY